MKYFLFQTSAMFVNAVYFLLGNSPAPEFYMPDVSERCVSPIFIGCEWEETYIVFEDGTGCSETSEHKIQPP